MLGPLFVYSLLIIVCFLALTKPAVGVIAFYGFMLLDPEWNWRWSLSPGFPYQKIIFISLALGFVLSGCRMQRLSPVSKWGVISLIAFTAWSYASAQQSVSPESTQLFTDVFWKQVLVILLGIVVLDSPLKLRALFVVAVLAQGYNAFQLNLDYFQTGFAKFAYRNWGSTGADNNGYSIITLPLMAAAFALAFHERAPIRKTLYAGIGILQIHQIMLMQSRGCMLAGIGVLGILVWYMPRKYGNIPMVAAGLVVTVVLAGPSVVKEFSSSFAEEGERDSSAESRFYLWKAGWRITKDYPTLGVGPNAARVLVPQSQYYEGGLEQSNKALHNLFFDVSSGTGVIGFFLYFFFLLSPLPGIYRSYNRADEELGAIKLAVLAGIPGYLVASMFSSGLLFESCYVLVVAAYCCANLAVSRVDRYDARKPPAVAS